uniref:Uncharacterized protein n=1 Tax=Tetradesmus obliquus TaxID=3088 RepID=A0A383V1P9_TETOB|eukprot:jgi/Sobl393_1/7719/SZX59487.1
MQHDALVAFVDLLGWLRDQHAQQQASGESQQQQQQQQQQPSLASLGNTSELLLPDQLRYLPYSGGGSDATAKTSEAAAAPHCEGLQRVEGEAAASSLEQRIAPQGDPMYWLRWMLAQPLHPEAYTITVEQLTAHYKQTLRELSMLLHQLGHGPGSAPAHSSSDAGTAAEQQSDSADAAQDPYIRMAKLILEHAHLMVSEIVAGRAYVLGAFCMTHPETGKARAEHDVGRYRRAVQQIKLKPEQVADMCDVMKVFERIYAPIAAQRRELQFELGLQPAGTTAGAAAAAAGGGSFMQGNSSSSSGAGGSSKSGAGGNISSRAGGSRAGGSSSSSSSSSRCTEADVQPPSSMLQHLTESDVKAQKLRRLQLLLAKEGMISAGVGQLLGGALELPQLARLMVLMEYPLQWVTFGLTVVEMQQQGMLQQGQQQQQQQQQHRKQQQGLQRQARRQQQVVLSKKLVSSVRKKLEVSSISHV